MEGPAVQRSKVVWLLDQVKFLHQQITKLKTDNEALYSSGKTSKISNRNKDTTIKELINKLEVCKKEKAGLEENFARIQKENSELTKQSCTVPDKSFKQFCEHTECEQKCKKQNDYLVDMKEQFTQDKTKYAHVISGLLEENFQLMVALDMLNAKWSLKALTFEKESTKSKLKIEQLRKEPVIKTQQMVMLQTRLNEGNKLLDGGRTTVNQLRTALNEFQLKAANLKEENINSKIKIEQLEKQLAMKTQQSVMLQTKLNERSKFLGEERKKWETIKREYEEKLVDASSLQADNDMLYKSLDIERKQSEQREVNLLKEIEILEEKLDNARQDMLDHQLQMATINKISEDSCAKYIRNCSLQDRDNIERELSRTKDQEERMAKDTAKILTRYASKKDSIKILIDKFEKRDNKDEPPETCEEYVVNNEDLRCSEESFIKTVEKDMLSLNCQGGRKLIEHLTPQKQISQTIVQADKVFYINSAVSHNITECETKAIEDS